MRGIKRERIVRVLLTESKPLSKNELSKKARCTRQWVILFLRQLERKKLLIGTKVTDFAGLIDYWFSIHRKPTKYREYMVKEPVRLLKQSKLEYALTTYQAENIVHHHLFPSRTDVYVKEGDAEVWHHIFLKEGLYGKGNVRVIATDEHTFYGKRKLRGLFVVSMPQLIIDLLTEGGPAAEAAEMLLANQHVS